MRILIFTISIAILSGCATTKLYNLQSLEKDVDLDNGTEISNSFLDSSVVSIAYEDNDEDRLIFYLKVTNNSNSKIEFFPHYIFLNELERSDNKSFNKTGKKLFSLNAEIQINVIERQLENQKGEKAFLSVLNFAAAATSIVLDISDEDSEAKAENVVYDIGSYADTQIGIDESYEYSKMNLLEERDYWKNKVLRTTTLYPGESAEGVVFQRTQRSIDYFELVIPFGEEEHKIIYRQTFKRI